MGLVQSQRLFGFVAELSSRVQTGEQRCPAHLQHKIRGFAEFLTTSNATVIPDPYYGDEKNFEHVLDLVEEASEGLMEFVIKKVHGHE